MWLSGPVPALVVTVIALFAVPGAAHPDPMPLRREGARLHVRAEPWFAGVGTAVSALAFAIAGLVVWSITAGDVTAFSIAAIAIGVGGTIAARLGHRTTAITLDDETLEVGWPRPLWTRTARHAVRDVRSIEIVTGRAGLEIDDHLYVERWLKILTHAGGTYKVPLPMDDAAGATFADDLRDRVARSAGPPDARSA